MGRTGKLFAHEWAGIAPDVMSIAKGIAGGFPMGAVLATEAVAKHLVPGTHGTTFGGNPLACAAANAVLDVVLAPGFLAEVDRKARRLWFALEDVVRGEPGGAGGCARRRVDPGAEGGGAERGVQRRFRRSAC